MLAVAYLQFRRILGGRRIWFLGIVLLLPVLLAGVIQFTGGFSKSDRELAIPIYLFLFYPQALCILLALLYGSSMLITEVEEKTLTYLFTRCLAKWKVIVSKYVTTALCMAGLAILSLLACWLIFGCEGGFRFFLGFAAATFGGALAYTAIFGALGIILPKRAEVAGLIYAVLMECMLSFVPAVVNTLTVTYYLRSLVVRIAGLEIPSELDRIVGAESILTCMGILTLMTAIYVALTSLIASSREFATADAP